MPTKGAKWEERKAWCLYLATSIRGNLYEVCLLPLTLASSFLFLCFSILYISSCHHVLRSTWYPLRMAGRQSPDPFYCKWSQIPEEDIECCSLSSNSSIYPCSLLTPEKSWCLTGDCIQDCQNLTSLYYLPANFEGAGYTTAEDLYNDCLNLPTVYGYFKQGLLPANYTDSISRYFPPTISDTDLQGITSSVTHCLITTCDNARDHGACNSLCPPVQLLINSTTPSFDGVSNCLQTLCNGIGSGFDGLPYANSDIVGIGVC